MAPLAGHRLLLIQGIWTYVDSNIDDVDIQQWEEQSIASAMYAVEPGW